MTARVLRRAPLTPSIAAHYIGKPYVAALAQGHLETVAHMLGAQMSMVANIVYGSSETTSSDTWAIAYRASKNARAVVVSHVPYGSTGSAPTISVANSETESPIDVLHTAASVTDLGDIPVVGRYRFVVPVTADTLQELSWTTANTRLHSTHVFEVPRAELLTTEYHVHRTFADAGLYITDDVTASNPRGFTSLLNQILNARTYMRRHVVNLPFRPGITSAGSASPTWDNLIGSLTTHGIRTQCRNVQGGAGGTMPVRCKVHVSALGGGSTHSVRFGFAGAGVVTDVTGINATGWWPGGAIGTAGQSATIDTTDLLSVFSTRTAGAGTLTIDSICVYEDS